MERGLDFQYNNEHNFLYESAELSPENRVKAFRDRDDVSESR